MEDHRDEIDGMAGTRPSERPGGPQGVRGDDRAAGVPAGPGKLVGQHIHEYSKGLRASTPGGGGRDLVRGPFRFLAAVVAGRLLTLTDGVLPGPAFTRSPNVSWSAPRAPPPHRGPRPATARGGDAAVRWDGAGDGTVNRGDPVDPMNSGKVRPSAVCRGGRSRIDR
jgi:hypothetical protein